MPKRKHQVIEPEPIKRVFGLIRRLKRKISTCSWFTFSIYFWQLKGWLITKNQDMYT